MSNSQRPFAAQQSDRMYTDLEAELLRAVSDFGVDELTQMLDAAEAIRRTRRV
jgi:hypothetical protein